jgi:hypothetical protein
MQFVKASVGNNAELYARYSVTESSHQVINRRTIIASPPYTMYFYICMFAKKKINENDAGRAKIND